MQAQVLFVSKPVVEPFNDGSKCLVRDISNSLRNHVPRIMVPRGADTDVSEDRVARVYGRSGSYRPALMDNAQVLMWLLTRSKEALWHFVFAPNLRTSQVAKALKWVRRVPIVQTVASPPRSFATPGRLLFGDVIVAQSRWTQQRFMSAFAEAGVEPPPRIEVIAPCVPEIAQPGEDRKRAARAQLAIGEHAPVLVYPGDLEVSHGAEWVAEAVPPLIEKTPNLCVVFAYRNKTPTAAVHAQRLRERLPAANVRVLPEFFDIHALIAVATGVLFPVDDLFGKVDIPIVLLEAMQLGTPVISLDSGPLADLQGVLQTAAGDIAALVHHASRLVGEGDFRQACTAMQRDVIERGHRPAHAAARYEAIYDQLLKTP